MLMELCVAYAIRRGYADNATRSQIRLATRRDRISDISLRRYCVGGYVICRWIWIVAYVDTVRHAGYETARDLRRACASDRARWRVGCARAARVALVWAMRHVHLCRRTSGTELCRYVGSLRMRDTLRQLRSGG